MVNGEPDDGCINHQINARPQEHLGIFGFPDVGLFFRGEPARAVEQEVPEVKTDDP